MNILAPARNFARPQYSMFCIVFQHMQYRRCVEKRYRTRKCRETPNIPYSAMNKFYIQNPVVYNLNPISRCLSLFTINDALNDSVKCGVLLIQSFGGYCIVFVKVVSFLLVSFLLYFKFLRILTGYFIYFVDRCGFVWSGSQSQYSGNIVLYGKLVFCLRGCSEMQLSSMFLDVAFSQYSVRIRSVGFRCKSKSRQGYFIVILKFKGNQRQNLSSNFNLN